jgi:predicted nucleic-acid-binding Zn-ribbon protein
MLSCYDEGTMKNTRVCPKCQSTEIVHVQPHVTYDNKVPVGILGLGNVTVARYVCSLCGYCEEWIDSARDLEAIRNNYPRA